MNTPSVPKTNFDTKSDLIVVLFAVAKWLVNCVVWFSMISVFNAEIIAAKDKPQLF